MWTWKRENTEKYTDRTESSQALMEKTALVIQRWWGHLELLFTIALKIVADVHSTIYYIVLDMELRRNYLRHKLL